MRAQIREKLDRLQTLYPPERLARSKERVRRLWQGEEPLDRLPFVLIPPDFSYYDDVFEPEEGLHRYLDAFIRRGVAEDDYIPAFFTGCRMGAMPSLFGAEEIVLGGDYSCKRLLTNEDSVRALLEPRILEGSPAKAWLDAQRYYLEETEGLIPVHVDDMQGPMDVSGQLWGYENVLALPYEDEDLYEFLMGRVTDAFLLLWNEQKRLLGNAFLPTHLYAWDWVPGDSGATLSADALVMLSPVFFRRWYKGALERISRELGGLTVHSCGDFSGVAAALCEVEGLRGINASQMSAEQLISAGARRDLTYIFQCPFERVREAVKASVQGGYRIQTTVTGAWPEDYAGAGLPLLKDRVQQLNDWFTPQGPDKRRILMKLSFETYRDKVMGCWAGKNIGGVLGAPFEAFRQFNEVDFYTQDLSMGPPPNDDLDLQIVWLAAVERYGRNVNASILGDYWLSYVIPNWVEYGTGKANLRAGLVPPMCGAVDNPYKDSCGCFIRSEIWACLAPGNPALAAKYAFEDAIVDHAGDGMQGEIFCAALQSAAFSESDTFKLIDIALSYIPEDSKVAEAVRTAVRCHAEGVPFRKAIAMIHDAAPGTFGIQGVTNAEGERRSREMGMTKVGAPGFDAAENVGYVIAGWLYGEDFGDQIIKANACGEDTDCTCATLGALLGIISGASGLPKKWADPLDDKIATMCIDKTSRGVWVPETVTQLTDRVLRVTPSFLGVGLCDILAEGGYTIECLSGDELFCADTSDYQDQMNGMHKDHSLPVRKLSALTPYVARYEFPAFSAMVDLGDSSFFRSGENRRFTVTVKNDMRMCQQQWARITLYAPDGVQVIGPKAVLLPLNNLWGSKAEATFEVNLDQLTGPKAELLVDITLEGRHSTGAVKIVMMRER